MTITNTYAGTRVLMLFYCSSSAATVLVPAALLLVVDDVNPIQSRFTATTTAAVQTQS